jgi:hypothetical protein
MVHWNGWQDRFDPVNWLSNDDKRMLYPTVWLLICVNRTWTARIGSKSNRTTSPSCFKGNIVDIVGSLERRYSGIRIKKSWRVQLQRVALKSVSTGLCKAIGKMCRRMKAVQWKLRIDHQDLCNPATLMNSSHSPFLSDCSTVFVIANHWSRGKKCIERMTSWQNTENQGWIYKSHFLHQIPLSVVVRIVSTIILE